MESIRSADERKARLENYVFEKLTNTNYTLIQKSDFRALLRYQNKMNNVGHFLFSIFTLGLWLPIWFLVAILSRPYSKEISIDEFGYISETKR